MKTRLILETLKKTERATDVLLGIFFGGYNYKKMKRKAFYPTLPDPSETNEIKFDPRLLEKEKHKFYSLLSKLKRQGFIKKNKKGGKVFWKITPLGEKRFEKLKNFLRFPKFKHKKEKDDGINIITFDIPEKHKTKRDWLRHTLSSLDFIILQKSVWIGKNKIPEEFLKALAELDLMNFIHILKISKTGTIKELDF
ncbi:MAG: hypothetical protein Q8N28_01965 [bacterium]|nr:hypothetical protein [bacterium]